MQGSVTIVIISLLVDEVDEELIVTIDLLIDAVEDYFFKVVRKSLKCRQVK